jgi:hypothetical protein
MHTRRSPCICGISIRLGVHHESSFDFGSICSVSPPETAAPPSLSAIFLLAAMMRKTKIENVHSWLRRICGTFAVSASEAFQKSARGKSVSLETMVETQLRQRGAGAARKGGRQAQGAAAGAEQGEDLPNPLTLQAVSTVFRRRWAMPMTIAVLCLAGNLNPKLNGKLAHASAGCALQVRTSRLWPLRMRDAAVCAPDQPNFHDCFIYSHTLMAATRVGRPRAYPTCNRRMRSFSV